VTLPRPKALDSQREALTKREIAAIRQPCLLMHGDKNQIHPIEHAYNMAADLVNAEDGAKLYTIKGIFSFIFACMVRIDAIGI
jgi:pimeloyl-ACP methyl ester carboxylesterase